MDAQEPNSKRGALTDPMQTVHQADHATVTPFAIDLRANFDQL